jgi:hypothetical protein
MESEGWVRIQVPDKTDPGKSFIYTAGLSHYHKPELVVTGTVDIMADGCRLAQFVKNLIKKKDVKLDIPFTFRVSRHDPYYAQTKYRRCMFRSLTEQDIKDTPYFTVTKVLCPAGFTMAQLILADDSNRLPTEKGYNSTFVQPLI